jgi:hypothetical protein
VHLVESISNDGSLYKLGEICLLEEPGTISTARDGRTCARRKSREGPNHRREEEEHTYGVNREGAQIIGERRKSMRIAYIERGHPLLPENRNRPREAF